MLSVGNIIGGTFEFVRRHVAVIAVWCAVYMVSSIVMSLLMRPMFDAQLMAMNAATPHMPEGMFGYMSIMYLVFGVMFVALFAATFRAVLKPDDGVAAYLRLGMDELRLFGLMIILFFACLLAFLVIAIVAMIIGIVAALVLGSAGTVVVALFLYCGIFGASFYVMVRLSAAAPLTMLRGRITIVEAWKLTKGHFWTLFGAYLSILLIVVVPFLCLCLIMMGGFYHHIFEASYDPTAFSQAMRAQMELQAPGRPMWFVGVVGGGLFGGFSVAMQGAMTAIATRALLAEKDAGEVFA